MYQSFLIPVPWMPCSAPQLPLCPSGNPQQFNDGFFFQRLRMRIRFSLAVRCCFMRWKQRAVANPL
jgi:hypothetical protein